MIATSTKLVIGGVTALGVLFGLYFWSKKASAADAKAKDPANAPPPKSDNPADYAQGSKDGCADGTADGKIGVKNARPLANYNADATRQKNYTMGYMDGYNTCWDAANAAAGLSNPGDLFTKDAIPPEEEEKIGVPGGAKDGGTTTKKAANDWYQIGVNTGTANGRVDGKNAAMGKGSFGATPRPAPPTDDPVPRDAWSLGYERGYGVGFNEGQASVKTGGARRVSVGHDPMAGVSRTGAWGRRVFALAENSQDWYNWQRDVIDADGFVHQASHPSFVRRSV